MAIRNFYDLDAWQKSHALVKAVYAATRDFPSDERYGMTSQMRRAVISVTANIAEGFARYHTKDKIRFYHHARGSVVEVQNFIILAKDFTYINLESARKLFHESREVEKLVNGLIRGLQSRS
jgi:four helix bundle protein